MSHGLVSLVERCHLDRIPLHRLWRLFAVFDAEVVVIRWRGDDIDRLADADHAALAESLARRLPGSGWGSSLRSRSPNSVSAGRSMLAWHAETRTLLVIEIKTEIAAVESTLRIHDVNVRLAPAIARARFGWEPASVGRLLVLPDERTPRRQVERHAALFDPAYRLRNVAVGRWLARPDGPMSGLMLRHLRPVVVLGEVRHSSVPERWAA